MIGLRAALLSLSLLSMLSAQAAACPGHAGWCDDFDHGAARWQAAAGAPQLRLTSDGKQVLQAADGVPVLIAGSETAPLTGAPYYVEARLRAASPGATHAYLLARFADRANWIGAGIALTPGSKRVTVDLAAMRDGKLVHLKQFGRDTVAAASVHTLRLEVAGDALAVYLDGERVSNAPMAFLPGGRVGVLAAGGGFDVGGVRIGAAANHPGRIALARMGAQVRLQAGDAPLRLPVAAFDGDGDAALPFTATSSDPAVAGVSIDGTALVVQAHRPGSAILTLTGRDDSNVAGTVLVAVGPAFSTGAQTNAAPGRFAPAPRATGVPPDTLLRITFDQRPTLGGGSVRIFRANDNALVDVIRAGAEVDALGFAGQSIKRAVRHDAIHIDGATVTIAPHSARLETDTAYYVAVDGAMFNGAMFNGPTIDGQPFTGIARAAGWSFHTRAELPPRANFTVDADGPADFRTVQGALNHAMRSLPREVPVTIRIANGRYEELLYLRGKDKLTLRGESRDGVVIHATNNDGINPNSGSAQGPLSPAATGGRALMLVEDADLLTLDNLTLHNTSLRATSTGAQAETLYFNSESGRLVATNAAFLSEQDTIQVKGYAWFYRALIAGNVDFIWGYNRAALFEESEIRSVGDSKNPDSGGFVVQARTVAAADPGFVFLGSRLTHGPGPAGNGVPLGATYLARSPGTANTWDNVSYINCRMDAHVAPGGWAGEPAPNPHPASASAGWREYGSMDLNGKPLDVSQRVGGHQLTREQMLANFGTRERVFQGFDGGKGWRPALKAEQ